jgi:hypothetical protein
MSDATAVDEMLFEDVATIFSCQIVYSLRSPEVIYVPVALSIVTTPVAVSKLVTIKPRQPPQAL